MKADNNKKNLDELITNAIGRDGLKFDFDKWKNEHKKEVQIYKSQKTEQDKDTVRIYRIGRMIMKSPIAKFVAAAVIIIAILMVFNNGSIEIASVTRAEVIERLSEVNNIHITMSSISSGQKEIMYEEWIRMPDCSKSDSASETIIDDGKKRIVYDKEKKSVQLSDSHCAVDPASIKRTLRSSVEFLNNNSGTTEDEVTFVALPKESTKEEFVFLLESPAMKGKAWINSHSRLLKKIEYQIRGENSDVLGTFEMVFDYKPVSDEIFDVSIPSDVKSVDKIESRILSGVVLDENDMPVPNAIVFASHSSSSLLETRTDTNGKFNINIPYNMVGIWTIPVLIKAYQEGGNNKVAWTLVRDANDYLSDYITSMGGLGGGVPGTVGKIEYYENGRQYKSATDIAVKMESAGKITGIVTDDSGNALGGVQFTVDCRLSLATEGRAYTPLNVGETKSNTDGNFIISNIPQFWKQCEFVVRVNKAGYEPAQTQFRTIGPLEEQKINFILKEDR